MRSRWVARKSFKRKKTETGWGWGKNKVAKEKLKLGLKKGQKTKSSWNGI